MMARLRSADLNGVEAVPVEVEVDVQPGMPSYTTVGLPDTSVKESRERVRGAILNSGFKYPLEQITVNLAPADVRKEGSHHDLAIALALLVATGQLASPGYDGKIYIGELALSGEIRPVRGVLPVAILAGAGREALVCPGNNAEEGSVVQNCRVYGFGTLRDVVAFLRGADKIEPHPARPFEKDLGEPGFASDFLDARGQAQAKRGLEVAAAGAHNILLLGPPGSGKSMLAKRLPSILPPMTFPEAIETTRVHSVKGERYLMSKGIVLTRPFRAPHHTISYAGMVGGGSTILPGEVSLAHNGVLFLDELTEFKRDVLESLRQPLEDRRVTISRAKGYITFPSSFMLLAASNPCPCGYYGDPARNCRCTPIQIQRYLGRISGPLLDRVDIQLEMVSIPPEDLRKVPEGESSAAIRERVTRARERQAKRFAGSATYANAQMDEKAVDKHCPLGVAPEKFLISAMKALGITARGHHRILKTARTIADLAGVEEISAEHIGEAIQYRSLDRKLFGA